MSDKPTITVTIVLNGTNENIYERWGLGTNPFPAIAKAEAFAANRLIADLARPTPHWSMMKKRLARCTPEFVDICEQMYEQGKVTRFTVTFPDPYVSPWEKKP